MIDVLVYGLSASPSTAADAVSREVSVSVNGAEPVVSTFPPTATDLGEVSAAQDSTVRVEVVDIDDAGNRSEPAVLEFVATDTIPPPVPGGLGVLLLREESVEDVTPPVEEPSGDVAPPVEDEA